ncbi:pro-neuregulin-3, membrane-bound isoform isoform X2 [Gadus macrocephalus]|uniref:pro-neuregulin-3, membrane-bound isoform isoform X2 n=1 Tax=Gadus macrocephalus TaxID=80720 RepID=UPI0028CB44B1|nr:pro-neuregulin-3, membrane-bound isoform isoform X2 [Gadus macrocephalus]
MSRKERQGRMSECSGAAVSGAVILEEPEGPAGASGHGEGQGQDQGPLRCGGCTLWPRQQTWLCVVPLLIGFIGLGLSLMLLKWIVVGTVRDYVPTDLVDANRIGQDPIFLSKPSGIPKIPETTTTTAASAVGGGNPESRTVSVARDRTHSLPTTTMNPQRGGASGSQVTPRIPGSRNERGPPIMGAGPATSKATTTVGETTASSSLSNPTVLNDSTQMWTQEKTTTQRVSTTPAGRMHGHRKTPSPTVPPLRSEHFKPCHERDLTYCLNSGECFVIETLSGPHKHCKCREGYQGIRCDQFLPKTDSILADPNHLGIEFMESKEVYKRQVLSITSIAMAISLLGTLCMALYCRNKRRREKLQAHIKESRIVKNYSGHAASALDPKARTPANNMQMHKFCKQSNHSPPRVGVCESGFANSKRKNMSKERGPTNHHSPDQRSRAAHWSAPRKTLPIPKRLNPIGGSKYSGPSYQHLQEVETSEREIDVQKGYQMQPENSNNDPRQDSFLRMQVPVSRETTLSTAAALSWPGHEAACSARLPQDRTLAGHIRPPRPSTPPTSFRSCSVPIIPSVQCHHDDEVSCMQTSPGLHSSSAAPSAVLIHSPANATPCPGEVKARDGSRYSPCSAAIGQKQDEVTLVLEEAQQQLRALALAHKKEEESLSNSCNGSLVVFVEAKETVCFLSPYGGGSGALSCNGPTETQLLSHNLSHRDLGYTGQ